MEGYEDPFCRRTYPWGREDEALLDYYCALGRLKNENAALRLGDVRVTEAGNGRLAFVRRYEAQLAKIFINRSDRDWILPEGEIRFGRGIAMDGERRRLQPNGFCVIYSEPAQPVK